MHHHERRYPALGHRELRDLLMRSLRLLVAAVLLAALPSLAHAAVAFDAVSVSANGAGDRIWTHTPVGTPRGILVLCAGLTGVSDGLAGVDYGGTAMAEISGSPNILTTGETGNTHGFFLGASIPTGPQTVTADYTDATNSTCVAYSVTATDDTEIVDSDGTINSTSSANPSVTLSLGGRTSFAAIAFMSGQNQPTSITPLTNWTEDDENDNGSETTGFYSYDTVSTTDVTAGWTQAAEDAVAIAAAVTQVVGGGGPTCVVSIALMGVGCR